MKKFVVLPLALVALAGLAACSPKAQNEFAEAANTMAADACATMNESVSDVDAATDNALGSAETTMDNTGNAIDNAADSAADSTGNALKDAGNDLED